MPATPKLKAHHVGCLTEDIGKSINHYREIGFSKISEVFTINSQKVKVCFIEIRENFFLELVEFSSDNSSLKKIFKTGNPYYHIGYWVENMAAAVDMLEGKGYRLIAQFNSEAFKNKPCAFLYSPEMTLVELMES